MKKRFIGVTIFSVIFMLGGALGLLSQAFVPLVHQSISRVLENEGASLEPQFKQRLASADAMLVSPRYRILATGTSIVRLTVGIGLFALQGWAYGVTLLVVTISALWLVVGGIIGGALFTGLAWVFMLSGLTWNGFVLWYFLRPSVKAQFQPEATKA